MQLNHIEVVFPVAEGAEVGLEAFEERLLMPWMNVGKRALVVLVFVQFFRVVALCHSSKPLAVVVFVVNL
jgi:hypothetical protein